MAQVEPEQRRMLGLHLRHRRYMHLGYDHEVHWRPGLDVMEREQLVVLVHLAAGNGAGGDFAENAVLRRAHGFDPERVDQVSRLLLKRIQPRTQRYKYQSQMMP